MLLVPREMNISTFSLTTSSVSLGIRPHRFRCSGQQDGAAQPLYAPSSTFDAIVTAFERLGILLLELTVAGILHFESWLPWFLHKLLYRKYCFQRSLCDI